MARSSRLDVFLRLSAALVGAMPVALYAALVLARCLPVGEQSQAALGYFLPLPLYVIVSCLAARARSGQSAWLACVLAALALKLGLLLA